MAELKAGSRVKSAVCATEAMVIAASGEGELTCGGVVMVGATDEQPGGDIAEGHSDGTLLGKRYVNEAGTIELLCTKPGDGSLALDSEILILKEAKALPSSD